MKKFVLFAFGIVCIAILIFLLKSFSKRGPTATIKNHTFVIDVATTSEQKEIGLAKYAAIEQDKGMYFPFDHSDYYGFWMKNMKFPIDIIFLQNKKIVTIFSDVKPQKNYAVYVYKPTRPANAVLEITAGLSKKYGFTLGDTLNLQL